MLPVENPWKYCGRQRRFFVVYYRHSKNKRLENISYCPMQTKGGVCLEKQENPVAVQAGADTCSVVDAGAADTSILQQMLDCGFAGDEDIAAFRERLGLFGDTWEGWLRDGVLPGELVRLSRSMAEMCAPWVWSSLLKLTEDGSVPAMKLYFDLCKAEAAGTETSAGPGGEILRLRREIFGGAERTGAGR